MGHRDGVDVEIFSVKSMAVDRSAEALAQGAFGEVAPRTAEDPLAWPDPRAVRGKLIAVEGIDGSGKSTQVYLLKRWLESTGHRVFFTEWNSSDLVREATRRGKKENLLTATTFCLIHATDFADRYERQILPLLRAGYVVLCDRYSYTALAPHAPYTVTDADLAATAELARDHGLPVHLHASENRAQADASLTRHGITPIEVLERTGILETDVLLAHGTGILERDLPVLARARGRTAVASAPRGYLKFAWPTTTPIRALREIGIPVGLATDGAASNNSLDVWESMALTALVQKSTEADPRWLTSRQALHHATVQSARAVGLGDRIGRIAPGRRADIVLVDLTGPHTQPVHDLAATLVHSARASDVRTTIVDGRVLMHERRLLTVDVQSVVTELTARLPALTDLAHGRRVQDYDT